MYVWFIQSQYLFHLFNSYSSADKTQTKGQKEVLVNLSFRMKILWERKMGLFSAAVTNIITTLLLVTATSSMQYNTSIRYPFAFETPLQRRP